MFFDYTLRELFFSGNLLCASLEWEHYKYDDFMFTGIIEETGKILEQTSSSLVIARPEIFGALTIGQSIAVNGACLSVVSFSDTEMAFDVMTETFRRTNLGEATGVNLERAMLSGGRFEGHVVLGHVDGKAQLISRKKEDSGEKFVFSLEEASQELESFFIEKGSVSLNGVSLTLGKISKIPGKKIVQFEIFCIPLTLEDTNLGSLEVLDTVNIEADYFAKIVQKNLTKSAL